MKAVLVGVDLDTLKVLLQPFDGDDPIKEAWSFREAIGHDFPYMTFGVLADEEAKEVRAKKWVTNNIIDDVNRNLRRDTTSYVNSMIGKLMQGVGRDVIFVSEEEE